MTPGPGPDQHRRARAGVGYGFGAYAIWGLLPLYFVLLAPATPYEIVALRVVFSLLFCLALLAVTGGGSTCGSSATAAPSWPWAPPAF